MQNKNLKSLIINPEVHLNRSPLLRSKSRKSFINPQILRSIRSNNISSIINNQYISIDPIYASIDEIESVNQTSVKIKDRYNRVKTEINNKLNFINKYHTKITEIKSLERCYTQQSNKIKNIISDKKYSLLVYKQQFEKIQYLKETYQNIKNNLINENLHLKTEFNKFQQSINQIKIKYKLKAIKYNYYKKIDGQVQNVRHSVQKIYQSQIKKRKETITDLDSSYKKSIALNNRNSQRERFGQQKQLKEFDYRSQDQKFFSKIYLANRFLKVLLQSKHKRQLQRNKSIEESYNLIKRKIKNIETNNIVQSFIKKNEAIEKLLDKIDFKKQQLEFESNVNKIISKQLNQSMNNEYMENQVIQSNNSRSEKQINKIEENHKNILVKCQCISNLLSRFLKIYQGRKMQLEEINGLTNIKKMFGKFQKIIGQQIIQSINLGKQISIQEMIQKIQIKKNSFQSKQMLKQTIQYNNQEEQIDIQKQQIYIKNMRKKFKSRGVKSQRKYNMSLNNPYNSNQQRYNPKYQTMEQNNCIKSLIINKEPTSRRNIASQLKIDSKIIDDQIRSLEFIFKPKKLKELTLLFRASENNFSTDKFYKYCNNISHTLILVKTQFNKVIGAYTPLCWKRTRNVENDQLQQSFLFSINEKLRFNLSKQMTRAIRYSQGYGPMFGEANFGICDKSNYYAESFFRIDQISNNSRNLNESNDTYEKLIGINESYYFKIRQWEVFKVQF